MKKINKVWIAVRSKVAMAMVAGCGVWALSAMNFAGEDPDVVQLMGACLLGLCIAAKEMEWNSNK